MTKYRFKSQSEFMCDNNWDSRWSLPQGWAEGMRKYIAKDISDDYIEQIEIGRLEIEGWGFYKEDIILNNPKQEYSIPTNTSPYILIRRKPTS